MSQPRFEPDLHDRSREAIASRGIHLSRYGVALPLARGKRVLDIACGAGYGVEILASAATRVTGADMAGAAVMAAAERAVAKNVDFVVCDGGHLPFGSSRFDLVTSFETLEHLEERGRFLREIRRVLVEEGLLLLSTPNARHTRPVDGRPRNPYHVHEYDPGELRRELCRCFGRVELSGQVLDERFRVPPFWDEQERVRADPRSRWRVALWRAINKLPYGLADPLARRLLGQALFPGEADYRFDADVVDSAPVLFARCRP